MIGRSDEAKTRTYSGVEFDVLVTGPESMVTKMRYRKGDKVPPHTHTNVQSGYVLSGSYRLVTTELDELLGAGDSYSIGAGVEHSIEVIDPGEVVDVFVPPRDDYL